MCTREQILYGSASMYSISPYYSIHEVSLIKTSQGEKTVQYVDLPRIKSHATTPSNAINHTHKSPFLSTISPSVFCR